MLFIDRSRVCFDVGWVGCVETAVPIADGKWHHVAVSVSSLGSGDNIHCYVDGRLLGRGLVGNHSVPGIAIAVENCLLQQRLPAGRIRLRWRPR